MSARKQISKKKSTDFIITYLMTELNIDQTQKKVRKNRWKWMLGIYRTRNCIFHFIKIYFTILHSALSL